jgi:hypothetical protein
LVQEAGGVNKTREDKLAASVKYALLSFGIARGRQKGAEGAKKLEGL